MNHQATTLYFVRHGQTDWNLEKRIQGHKDIPLNETGRSQARKVAEQFADVDFDICHSSDLKRALETAEIITFGRQISPQTDPLLRERNLGKYEGMLFDEYFANKHNLDPSETESSASMVERLRTFLLKVQSSGETQLAVSHGGMLKRLLVAILGYDEKGIIIDNSAFVKITNKTGQWEMLEMNGVRTDAAFTANP